MSSSAKSVCLKLQDRRDRGSTRSNKKMLFSKIVNQLGAGGSTGSTGSQPKKQVEEVTVGSGGSQPKKQVKEVTVVSTGSTGLKKSANPASF